MDELYAANSLVTRIIGVSRSLRWPVSDRLLAVSLFREIAFRDCS